MASGRTRTVFVVDDDAAVRKALRYLLESADLKVETFESGEELLDREGFDDVDCMLVDVRMSGMSGLDLQESLRERGVGVPVVILTGYASVPTAVRAMRAGAYDYLEKPFDDRQLLDRIDHAIERGHRRVVDDDRAQTIRARIETLTPREIEVMGLVVEGRLTKQIAELLSISVKTVENHRTHLMEKMQATNVADLVRMVLIAEFA